MAGWANFSAGFSACRRARDLPRKQLEMPVFSVNICARVKRETARQIFRAFPRIVAAARKSVCLPLTSGDSVPTNSKQIRDMLIRWHRELSFTILFARIESRSLYALDTLFSVLSFFFLFGYFVWNKNPIRSKREKAFEFQFLNFIGELNFI